MSERLLAVRAVPRARRDEIVGERGGAVVIRIAAPPTDGRANEALRRLIARVAGVPRGRVEIVRGTSSREKLVRVAGLGAEEVRSALLSHMRPDSDP